MADLRREDVLAALRLLGGNELAARELLREHLRTDAAWWCALCLESLTTLPFNGAHLEILAWFDALAGADERLAQRAPRRALSIEAPRGLAKTTVLKMVIAHRLTYGLERFVVWGGPGSREAASDTSHIRAIFDTPSPMMEWLYGPFQVAGGVSKWTVRVGWTQREITLTSRGFPKTRVRGINHQGQRPTLIVADDLEHPKEVLNPATRNTLSQYLQSDVRNAGPKEGGLVYVQVGTRLHEDGQTARNAKDRAFESMLFRSIISWPDRADLWSRCRELWADLTDPQREETARQYYLRHQGEMDRGARVLDPVAQPLYLLQTLLWSQGESSFFKDYQNDPIDPTRQVFVTEKFRRCRAESDRIVALGGRVVPLNTCRLAVWLDPRASRELTTNDYAACALVAREQLRHGPGYWFVLRCLMGRVATEEQLAWLWSMYDLYPGAQFNYEDNGFQVLISSLLEAQRRERRERGQPADLALRGHHSGEAKNDRILSLAPKVALGWIEFADDLPAEALDQFRQFPTGTHDDAPDAIERAVSSLEDRGRAKLTSSVSL